ncbi:hypothetical protein BKI52_21020 [marine bacterium AO1-C]|nr:hypothetical protein BKI52_21020 [marine bacterium AO1-C]
MISLLKAIWHFSKAFIYYKLKGFTPSTGFHSMRQLFVMTNGRFNDWFSFGATTVVGKYRKLKSNNPQGVLGGLSKKQIKDITKGIKNDGYYIFENTLSEETVKELVRFAETTPSRYLVIPEKDEGPTKVGFSQEGVLYDRDNVVAPKYVFQMQQLLENPLLRKLIFDSSLLTVAQSYLGCKPILDLIAMWWSAPFNKKGAAEAAQMYHFDLDRIKFLKFFFYLTDVESETGPFCYVKNSHHRLPKPIREDRRLTDEEVKQYFPADHILELTGKKGTIMAVDTRGLHKGKPLLKGERLIFQLEYCNSYFGVEYPKVNLPATLDDHSTQMFNQYPKVYSRILKKN